MKLLPKSVRARLAVGTVVSAAAACTASINTLGLSTQSLPLISQLSAVSGAAKSKRAEALAQNASADDPVGPVRQAATDALKAEPLDFEAARTLASIAVRQDELDNGRTLFRIIGQRTLRERVVQIFLLGDTFERGEKDAFQDAAETLLKTRPGMRDQILSMFAQLVDKGEETERFRTRLAQRPEWRSAFFSILGQVAEDGEKIYQLMVDQKERGAAPSADELRVWLLFESGRASPATLAKRWRELQNPALPAEEELLRNPGFEGSVAPPPFDWVFLTQERSFAEIGPAPDGNGRAMFVELGGRQDAVTAVQLLDLDPGNYTLSGRIFAISDLSDEQMRLSVTCMRNEGGPAPLATAPLSGPIDSWAKFDWQFTVPSGCPVQQLSVGFDAGLVSADLGAYLDDLNLVSRDRK